MNQFSWKKKQYPMTVISTYIQHGKQANMKIGMLMFEHEDRQLHPQGMKYKHIDQVSSMVQINHHHYQ